MGIRDTSLSECLQIESNLTLEQAKKFIRQREAIQQQQSILKSNSDTRDEALEPMYVNKSTQGGKKFPGNSGHSSHRQALPTPAKYCRRCGKPVNCYSNATRFAAIEKGILVLNVYRKPWESLLPHHINNLTAK